MDSKTIIDALGGPAEVARLCEVNPQAVSQWYGIHRRGKHKGQARQIPPARLMYLKAIKPGVFEALQQPELAH